MKHNVITKEKLLHTIAQKGNDIDLIFRGDEGLTTGKVQHYDDMHRDTATPSDLRDRYMLKTVPALLKQHGIEFSHEYERIDGSGYQFSPNDGTASHTKYKTFSPRKRHTINIRFPDCRPIHIDVQPTNNWYRYLTERAYMEGGYSLLYHYMLDKLQCIKLLESNSSSSIPEHLSLEEKIATVRKNKKRK
jgi:uncharacterized membrane protein YfhO